MGRAEFLQSLIKQHQLRIDALLGLIHYDEDSNEVDEPQRYAAWLHSNALGSEGDALLTVSTLEDLFYLFLVDHKILGSYSLAEMEAVYDLDREIRIQITINVKIERRTIRTKTI